jgi:predicted Zn finger-like uncharacterized protein
MIVVCPACGRRFRLEPSRLGPGARLRCSGCREVFEMRPAGGPPARPAALPRPAAEPASAAQRGGLPQPRGGAADGAPLVLIGDANRPFRAAARSILEGLGCRVEMMENGEAIFRAVVARRPALLLLNTRLPGLSGAAVCEGVKGSPHLRGTSVVLVSSTVHPGDPGGESRPGLEPDDRIEDTIDQREMRHRLAHLLGDALPRPAARPAGIPLSPAPAPSAAPPGSTIAMPAMGRSHPQAGSPAQARERAPRPASPKEIDSREALDPQAEIERLARIMLSDLKLYNPDRFASAMQEGRLLETFRTELLRGKDLITSRFPDLPDRIALLTAALRQGIDEERGAAG